MNIKLIVFVMYVFFNFIKADDEEYLFERDYNVEVYRKYNEMDKNLREFADKGTKTLLPYIMKARENTNISASCTENLFTLIMGFRQLSAWSFNFLDATGKLQSGLQKGNFQQFGEYEQCVETTVQKKGKIHFDGQYCSVLYKPPLPKVKKIPSFYGRLEGLMNATRNTSEVMKLLLSKLHFLYSFDQRIGVCVPSGCSHEDVSQLFKYLFENFYLNATVTHCLKKGDVVFWTKTRTTCVAVFVLLGILLIISTLLDNTVKSWKNNKLGFSSRILQCFSVTRNFPKLINTDLSEGSIACFNGIRTLTIFWIILGHEYFMQAATLTSNHLLNYEFAMKNFFSQIALNGFMATDAFFFLGGFLNCYLTAKLKKSGKPQPGILKIIIHRLWRVYPGLIICHLLFPLFNMPGPIHYVLQTESAMNCRQNWWRNFLFINIFSQPETMCMQQLWYLSVDMILFLITLFTIPILLRKPKKGVILHVALILIVNLGSMPWWWLKQLAPSTLDGTKLSMSEISQSLHMYILPPVHVGPYFIGIIMGYFIACESEIKISKVFQVIGWLLASFFFTSMLFLTLRWNSGIPYTQLESGLYGAFCRTIYILGLSWMVLCCITGYAGIINYILSLKIWIPLSRITYILYLTSPFIQMHYVVNLNFPYDLSNINIIWSYFGSLSISLLLSLALVLLAEYPIVSMEKVFFKRRQEEKKEETKSPNQIDFDVYKTDEKGEKNGRCVTIQV